MFFIKSKKNRNDDAKRALLKEKPEKIDKKSKSPPLRSTSPIVRV
jgi:hypothetical protein